MKNAQRVPPVLPCYDDLAASCAYAWSMIEHGAKDSKTAFHTPSVATICDNRPTIRTVVLRDCDTSSRCLRFHTDMRSSKIAELQDNPRAAMHFYDAQAKVQLRLGVILEILDGDAYDAAWQATRPMSRECYQVTRGPSSPIADPSDVTFDADSTHDGADHFAPIRARVENMEWLYLASGGHRRALFDFCADTMIWLVP